MPKLNLLNVLVKYLSRFSLRAKLMAGFGTLIGLILVMGVTGFIAQRYIYGEADHYFRHEWVIDHLADKSLAALSKARRLEQNFFMQTKEIGYQDSRARTLPLFKMQLEDLRRSLQEIPVLCPHQGWGPVMQEIILSADRYEAGFLAAADLVGRLGTRGTGLEGAIYHRAQGLEAILQEHPDNRLTMNLLHLRRHKKDFVMYGRAKDAAELRRMVSRLQSDAAPSGLPPAARARFLSLLGEYQDLFQQYVEGRNRLKALQEDYHTDINRAEPWLTQIQSESMDKGERCIAQIYHLGQTNLGIAAGTGLLAVGLGLFIGLVISRNIQDGVEQCTEFSRRLAGGDLAARISREGRDEFAALAASLNLMADSLAETLEEVQTSAKRQQTILQTAMDGYAVVDTQGRLLEVNPAYCRMSGYRAPELLTMSIADLDVQESAGETAAQIQKIMEQGGDRFETRHRRQDGSIYDTEVSAQFLDLEGGRFVVFQRDISERKRTELELARLAAIIEATPDFVGIADAGDTHMLYINPAGRRMVGIGPDEDVTRVKIADTHSAGTNQLIAEVIMPTVVREGVWTGEIAFLARDGREIPVLSVALAHRDARGEVVAFSTVSRDIRELKAATVALAKLAGQHRVILEALGEGVFGLDLDGNHTFVNPAAAKMLGYEVEELIGRHSHSTWHYRKPDGSPYPEAECPIYATMRNGSVQHDLTEVFWRKDGAGFPVEVTTRPIMEEGKIVGAVVSFRDISERQRAEAVLRQSEGKYRALLENAGDAIAIADREGQVIEGNRKFEELLGYSREEFLQMQVPQFLPPETSEEALGVFRRVFERGLDIAFDYPMLRKDGAVVRVDLTGAVIDYGDQKGAVGIFRDAAPRHELERTLRRAKLTAEAALEEKNVLLREVYHRVKNNLQVITALLALQARSLPDPAARSSLKECRTRVETMALIHEKLYRSSDLAHINFADYAGDLIHRLFSSFGAQEAGIRLHLNLPPATFNLDTAVPLGLLLNELVSNSLKHAFPARAAAARAPGGGRAGPAITVALECLTGGEYLLTVADNGVGLPAGLDYRHPATLGLTLVNTLAAQLDGVPEVEPGPGTHIAIRFKELLYQSRGEWS